MEESQNGRSSGERGPVQQGLLAALGWVALTAEAADEFADELARQLGLDRDQMRRAVRDVLAAWRREGARMEKRREDMTEGLVSKLKLAQRDEVDDLALRVAQLEHRIGLLERDD
jgi:polyhydroxyalkanoate synthesis regulator phasin